MFMDSAAFSDREDVFSGLNRRGTFMMKRRATRRSNVCMASLARLRGGMASGISVRAMCNSTDAFDKIKQFLSVSAGRQGGGHEIREHNGARHFTIQVSPAERSFETSPAPRLAMTSRI